MALGTGFGAPRWQTLSIRDVGGWRNRLSVPRPGTHKVALPGRLIPDKFGVRTFDRP